ncbi:MAG: 16S rRNA (cytosine1402-N4)-methyltransferase [Alteromonas naphthalenivorans]|jgi:16S rRNA (cytosine1402-N4)-methyltransferase
MIYHVPVMLKETLEMLNLKPHKTYLDVTFGGGGHTRAILESDPTIKVIGLDWDKEVIERGEALQDEFPDRLTLIWGSFSHLYKLLKKHKITQVDGILADFGTSQHQIHTKDGLSFANDTPLDMRMSQAHHKTKAYDIVNYGTAEELRTIFWTYGEEKNTKEIVNALTEERQKRKIKTTGQLAAIIKGVSPRRGQKIHPATRVFQALRIVVNKELDNITAFLPAALKVLSPGGHLVCISFHSLEDRIVKEYCKESQGLLKGEVVKPFPVKPTEQEVQENPPSRSAKLRVFEKKV